ncbi:MAG: hypothetical protein QS748_14355 [Candidatus Endonucleobacter bathymodioli]|uniref:Uncharacterized protein n=1 Tax=Candidatus Endonucleibacter bathymodioli TaxID=539814 RepID=A0AA90NZ33_9GAMM|nr:hypothetical protein [Candidatus Endonucleobacter bathymodioli]
MSPIRTILVGDNSITLASYAYPGWDILSFTLCCSQIGKAKEADFLCRNAIMGIGYVLVLQHKKQGGAKCLIL